MPACCSSSLGVGHIGSRLPGRRINTTPPDAPLPKRDWHIATWPASLGRPSTPHSYIPVRAGTTPCIDTFQARPARRPPCLTRAADTATTATLRPFTRRAMRETTQRQTIEYTTELQANLRAARPRRPARSMRKPAFNPSLDIFEDVAQEEEQRQSEVDVKRRSRASIMPEGTRTKKSTILAHPAQKIPKVQSLAQEPRRRASYMPGEIDATVQLRENMLREKRA